MGDNFQATDSALGYYYQGLYALSYFMNSSEDEEEALIEDLDDFVVKNLNNSALSLKQIKHKKSSILSIKSKDIWTTLRIWCEYAAENDITNVTFHLITCSSLQADSELLVLCLKNSSREKLQNQLEKEAKRVISERNFENSNTRHQQRYKGCEKFLQLSFEQRMAILNRIVLKPSEFDINYIEEQIVTSNLLQSCPPKMRKHIAQKLIEWWDYQVLLFLRKERSAIRKIELQTRIVELIQEQTSNELIDSFSSREPLDWEEELTDTIRKQLEIINSGNARKKRAAINYWRAREQRNEWLEEDIPLVSGKLNNFDKKVIEEWSFKFDTCSEDNPNATSEEHVALGKQLFDWGFNEIPKLVEPISTSWSCNYLARGTLQILSDQLTVGWHLEFKEKLKEHNIE